MRLTGDPEDALLAENRWFGDVISASVAPSPLATGATRAVARGVETVFAPP